MAVDRSDYWYFNRAITPKRCKHIIDLAHKEGFHRGSISKEQITNTKVRKSEVCFLNKQFLFDLINTVLPGANKSAAWNFEYSWIEDIQITKYETGDHYDWHMDSTLVPYDDPKKTNIYGKVRKISVILPLSDPKTYGGGNFQLSFGKAKTIKEGREQGTMLFFPSYLWHRVTPLTKGTRYSLVAWICGKPFV